MLDTSPCAGGVEREPAAALVCRPKAGGAVTRRDDGGAGEPAAGVRPRSASADSSAWAPLRRRTFRWLWLGVLIGWTGIWMQTVGAQWLLVDEPNAAALVSLV